MHRSRSSDINSKLLSEPEWPSPAVLVSNANSSFLGSQTLGQGFILTPEERKALVKKNRENAKLIFPYIGGKEVNTSPTQEFHRYVINFGSMSLGEAAQWPDLLDIVRRKVKPERDKNKRDGRRKYWWLFDRRRPALCESIRGLERCLVTAQVTKHLCFSFQPAGRVYSQTLIVFPFTAYTQFAVLQSRVYAQWVWLLSSTMKTDLNYSTTDCFENFPFPKPDPSSVIPELENPGQRLYEARAEFMRESGQGLTKTYNTLKDRDCEEPDVLKLRQMHEQLDNAVLDAYGWGDIEVPSYEESCEKFRAMILKRLFELNSARG